MRASTILVVDDEPQTRRVLRIALVAQGFAVEDAGTGEEALAKFRAEPPDVVLLDLKMPGIGGLAICREIRERSEVPIIIVSARNSPGDRTAAFEAGADQFVAKPCEIQELIARIQAAKRRVDSLRPPVLLLGDVEVNFETHEVKRKDGAVHLTAKEFKLLYCLASRPGRIISHRGILQAVWGPDYGDEFQYLRVFIHQLRKKIEPDPAHPTYILAEPSIGYRLAVPPREYRQKARTAGMRDCEES